MILSIIIYVTLLGLNIYEYLKHKGIFNLLTIIFMIVMSFVIKWNNL